jgi:hypothetical protein
MPTQETGNEEVKIETVNDRRIVRVHDHYCRIPTCHSVIFAGIVPFDTGGKKGPAPTGSRLWRVDRFFCSNPDCGALYEHPPKRPNAKEEIERLLPVSDGGVGAFV